MQQHRKKRVAEDVVRVYLDPNIHDTLKPRRGRAILGSESPKNPFHTGHASETRGILIRKSANILCTHLGDPLHESKSAHQSRESYQKIRRLPCSGQHKLRNLPSRMLRFPRTKRRRQNNNDTNDPLFPPNNLGETDRCGHERSG